MNEPLKSPKPGNWFSRVIGNSVGSKFGVNVNSQSKASAPHLSSHWIKYSCPETTATSASKDPKVVGASQPSSSLATGVNVSHPSVYTYNLVSIPVGSEAQELIPIVPSPSAV